MKLILKDIPKIDSVFLGGEPNENYEKRRMIIESDSYILEGLDEDITTVENWNKYGAFICSDYLQIRDRITDAFSWDNNPTNSEVDIAIAYNVNDSTKTQSENDANKVAHIMSHNGISALEAQMFMLDSFSVYHTKEKESCQSRAYSEALTRVILLHLNVVDALDFNNTIRLLKQDYIQEGVWGTDYGVREGLMDYIGSKVGTTYDGAGLEETGYTINNGLSWGSFKSGLEDILVNGNY